MRNYRRRRGRGLRCIQVQVGPAELDALVAEGYLLPGNREDSDVCYAFKIPLQREAVLVVSVTQNRK